jgi:predicted amidohydrolase YtcJ
MSGTLVYRAKRIITMNDRQPTADAVAVREGKFVAVGDLAEVLAIIGPDHEVLDDFADAVLLPGLIDQHLHPLLGATTLTTEVIAPEDWNLPRRRYVAASTPADFDERITRVHEGLDPGDWLFSWGWHHLWHGHLDRSRLDRLVGARPAAIWQRSCHEWILNSAALDALGLTRELTQGYGLASEQIDWEKGHFFENGWMTVLAKYLMPVFMTPERFTTGLKQLVEYLHMNGVTAINEPGIFWRNEPWDLYQEVLGHPDVPFESTFLVEARTQPVRGLTPHEFVHDAKTQVERGRGGKVRVLDRHVKLFADGAIISQLMQMKDPYLDAVGNPDPGHHGHWITPPDELKMLFDVYWDDDWQIHIHVNGDLGLEILLGIIEEAQLRKPRIDHRTVVVHFANSSEDQVDRIAQLGAIVSANPYYPVGFADKFSQWGLGPDRADVMVRSASVLARGIPFSLHSDLPMCPGDPMLMASFAVNRVTASGRVAGPEQRIDVDSALRAVTIQAAYSWRREDELGSIEVGKIANLTALDFDPYDVDPSRIGSIPIRTTMFEGRVFDVDPALVEQRSGLQARDTAPSTVIAGIPKDEAGCSCEVASFLAQHMRAEGWAA